MDSKYSDIEIIALYRQQYDKKYIGELYTRYSGFAYSVCLKYLRSQVESEDAVMQIFEQLFESLRIHSPQNFKPWLYTVIKNYCFQFIIAKTKCTLFKNQMYKKNPHTHI